MPLYTGRVTQGDRKPDPGGLVGRWPLVFCGLVVVGLVALTYISRLLVPELAHVVFELRKHEERG